jgi:hypothetical protein
MLELDADEDVAIFGSIDEIEIPLDGEIHGLEGKPIEFTVF